MKKIKMSIFIFVVLFLFFVFGLNINQEIFDRFQKFPKMSQALSVFNLKNYFDKSPDEQLKTKTKTKTEDDTDNNINNNIDIDDVGEESKKLVKFEKQIFERFRERVKSLDNYDLLKGFDEGAVQKQVITDNKKWFVMKLGISMPEVTNYFEIYYNIDKQTGEIVALQDLFEKILEVNDYSNYFKIISEEIKLQIKNQMQDNQDVSYFEDVVNDLKIGADQDFYINKQNKLVIVFQKYDIAPGYMGCPEFEISAIDLENISKN